jgi:hypothetical protein
MGVNESHVVILDQRQWRTWEERVWPRAQSHQGRAIGVWRM